MSTSWPASSPPRSSGRSRISGSAGAHSAIRSLTALPAASPSRSATLAPSASSSGVPSMVATFEETITERCDSSRAMSTPCGWMAPGTWIGSRSHVVRSTSTYAGVWLAPEELTSRP